MHYFDRTDTPSPKEATMTATHTRQTPTQEARNPATPPRPVHAVLLELTYQLHATKVLVNLPASNDWRPRKSR